MVALSLIHIYGGFITVNLRAGAAVADGVVAVIVDDGFITCLLYTSPGWI